MSLKLANDGESRPGPGELDRIASRRLLCGGKGGAGDDGCDGIVWRPNCGEIAAGCGDNGNATGRDVALAASSPLGGTGLSSRRKMGLGLGHMRRSPPIR